VANAVLNPTLIAKAAVRILDNELVASKHVFRGYEEEFNKTVNGYKPGASINIRKPTQFTVRTGAVASAQDVTEGQTSITVDQQIGVDFKFSSTELTLNIGELADRVIKPAMVQLANAVDVAVLGLVNQVPNLVGTRGSSINTFAKFMAGVQRSTKVRFRPTPALRSSARPTTPRCSVSRPRCTSPVLPVMRTARPISARSPAPRPR
jgi:hypothetical protein